MTVEEAIKYAEKKKLRLEEEIERPGSAAKDANTGEDIVVYRGNYGNCPVFVRPLRNFNDFVDRNGYRGPRFQEIKY